MPPRHRRWRGSPPLSWWRCPWHRQGKGSPSASCCAGSLERNLELMIILGFQHYILVLGTAVMISAVLVPMMCGSDMSLMCLCASCFTPPPVLVGVHVRSDDVLGLHIQGDRVRVVQMLLFVTGINTLLVASGSYASIIPVMAIMQDVSRSHT